MENWEKLFCEGRGWCCFLNKEFHLEYVEFKITTRPSGRGTYHKNLETNIKIWSLAKGSGTEGNPEREMYLRSRKKSPMESNKEVTRIELKDFGHVVKIEDK